MRKIVMTVFVFGALFSLAETHSDEKIKSVIVGAWCYIDNPNASERAFDAAFALCESDTNRFARLLSEIALTNVNLFAETAVNVLGYYGTPTQLPYLYSVVTNEIRGAEAAKAILRIEGVTTNSILAVSNCLSHTAIDVHDRYVVFCNFLDRIYQLPLESPYRTFGSDYAWWLAPRENSFCRVVDEELIKHNPSYRTSKRRLATLRSVRALGVNEFQLNYITNAINELVAYPEADLPE